MGGPRITEQQKVEMRALREKGATFKDISKAIGLSEYAARAYTGDIAIVIETHVLKDGEQIKSVDGYGDRYSVSNYGRVFSMHNPSGPHELTMHPSKKGGPKVSLRSRSNSKLTRIDHLVANAFCERESNEQTVVVHVDGNIENCNASNLIWAKPAPPQKKIPKSKRVLNDSEIINVRERWLGGDSIKAIAKDYNVSYTTVWKQLDGLYRDIHEPPCEEGEEWKPIAGYEDEYYVSSFGRVYATGRGRYDPKIMIQHSSHDGYKTVHLHKDGEGRGYSVHRLVAEAFCDGYSKQRNIVNHIDGDTTNNHADNLEWCTPQENTRHAIEVLGHEMGGSKPFHTRSKREVPQRDAQASPLRRFTDDQVRSIRDDPRSARQLAKMYGVNKCTIINIRRGFTYRDVP